jgi:hypothetical protein
MMRLQSPPKTTPHRARHGKNTWQPLWQPL